MYFAANWTIMGNCLTAVYPRSLWQNIDEEAHKPIDMVATVLEQFQGIITFHT